VLKWSVIRPACKGGGRIGGRNPCTRVATSKISGNRWKSLEIALVLWDTFSQWHRIVDLKSAAHRPHSKYPESKFIGRRKSNWVGSYQLWRFSTWQDSGPLGSLSLLGTLVNALDTLQCDPLANRWVIHATPWVVTPYNEGRNRKIDL
jgi:hypothetical protein